MQSLACDGNGLVCQIWVIHCIVAALRCVITSNLSKSISDGDYFLPMNAKKTAPTISSMETTVFHFTGSRNTIAA